MDNRIEELITGSASATSASAAPGRPAARSSLHGPPARTVPPHEPECRSATVRDELESALNGAALSRRDLSGVGRRFHGLLGLRELPRWPMLRAHRGL